MSLTQEQRKQALESLKEHGTMVMAAKAANTSTWTLRHEMKRSPYFKKQIEEARDSGRTQVGDNALTMIETIAFNKDTPVQTRLTANLALCNAFVPGFKGVTHTEGKIDHNVRVVTAIPRPQYNQVVEAQEVKLLPPVDQSRLAHNLYMRNFMRNKRAKEKVLRANASQPSAQSLTVNPDNLT